MKQRLFSAIALLFLLIAAIPAGARPFEAPRLPEIARGVPQQVLAATGTSEILPSFTLVAHTSASSSDTVNVTTPSINTTGATLLVAVVGYLDFGFPPTNADSYGNTWTAGTLYVAGSTIYKMRIYYCAHPTVGAGHTFSANAASGAYPGIAVQAWSQTLDAQTADSMVGAGSDSATSQQPGVFTAAHANSLIITGLESGSSLTIGSGFTITDNPSSTGQGTAPAIAYRFQGTAIPINPLWSTSAAANPMVAAITAFQHS